MSRRLAIPTTLLALAAVAQADAPDREFYELSAPLLPAYVASWQLEGDKYPTDLDTRIDAALASLAFDELLGICAPLYPEITLPAADGASLTPEQLATNYNRVAKCAYEQYFAKPYWIPQLVDDVDVCTRKLGTGWHLPTEADVETLTDVELQHLQDLIAPAVVSDGENSWGQNHFGTDIFVRGADGTLRAASLKVGVTPRTHDLEFPSWMPESQARRTHFEGNVGVRCVRRTIVNAL